jgi:hypothetical protein
MFTVTPGEQPGAGEPAPGAAREGDVQGWQLRHGEFRWPEHLDPTAGAGQAGWVVPENWMVKVFLARNEAICDNLWLENTMNLHLGRAGTDIY